MVKVIAIIEDLCLEPTLGQITDDDDDDDDDNDEAYCCSFF